MKIRVYINSRESYLFDNISIVKDGASLAESRDNKLVLMRTESGSTAFPKTIAVFNHWLFWKQVNDDEQKRKDYSDDDSTQISIDRDAKSKLKKFSKKDLKQLFDRLSDAGAFDKENGGLHVYGLMHYTQEEMKRREKKEAEKSGICTTGHL